MDDIKLFPGLDGGNGPWFGADGTIGAGNEGFYYKSNDYAAWQAACVSQNDAYVCTFTLITVCTVIFSTWYTLSKSISRHKLMILTYRNNTFGHLFVARPRAPTPLLPPLLPPSTILLSLSRSFSSSLHNQVPHAGQPIQRHVSDRLRRRVGRRHPLLHEKQGVRHYRHQVPCLEP